MSRIWIRVFFFVVLIISMFLSGCGGKGQEPLQDALQVIFASPSWDVTIVQNQSIEFRKTVKGGVGPYTYVWDFDGSANNSTEENPGKVVFNVPGNYHVKLTVTDNAGTSASAAVNVKVKATVPDLPPAVRYTIPAYGDTHVPIETDIQAIFSDGVDYSTITGETFQVRVGGMQIPGKITTSNQIATFVPDSGFQLNTLYTAVITTGVKDISGNTLFPSDYVWTFSTVGYTLNAVIENPSENLIISEGQSIDFRGSATGGRAPYAYKWNFSGGLPISEVKEPGSLVYAVRGTYTVVFRVFDADGYVSFATRTVTVYSITAGDWTQVTAGRAHTLALKSDNTLWAWGYNGYGQIGNGTHINRSFPVGICPGINWAAVSAGADHSLALRKDGTLCAWGKNDSGQLGIGTTIGSNIPVQAGTKDTWASIAAGYGHSLAIKKDGTLWAWGLNTSGQLGDGSFNGKNTPVQVGTENDWMLISAGYGHSLAIKKNNTLWAWGLNDSGQLGIGTFVKSGNPVCVGPENTWITASAGFSHSIALTKNGALWAWGGNNHGQIGDGTAISRNIPARIGNPEDVWTVAAATYLHSIAVKKDGSLWAWGQGINGQFGDGSVSDKKTPVQIGYDSDWSAISAGYYHTVAMKTCGTLWTWGYNATGQLGDRTMYTRTSPVQVKW